MHMDKFAEQIEKGLEKFVPGAAISINLGLIGVIATVALLLVALAVKSKGKIAEYRRKLIALAKTLRAGPDVADSGLSELSAELETHPSAVRRGWASFLDKRVGFPSDYIDAERLIADRSFDGKRSAEKMFLGISGTVVWLATGIIGISAGVASGGVDATTALIASQCALMPIAAHVAALLLLDICHKLAMRRLCAALGAFCEALDSKIAIEDKAEREFVADNIEEIDRQVGELAAARLSGESIAEVISVPRIDDIEELTDADRDAFASEEESVDATERADESEEAEDAKGSAEEIDAAGAERVPALEKSHERHAFAEEPSEERSVAAETDEKALIAEESSETPAVATGSGEKISAPEESSETPSAAEGPASESATKGESRGPFDVGESEPEPAEAKESCESPADASGSDEMRACATKSREKPAGADAKRATKSKGSKASGKKKAR